MALPGTLTLTSYPSHHSTILQLSIHLTHLSQFFHHSNIQFHHSLLQPPTETPSQQQGSIGTANHRSPLAVHPALAPDWPMQSQPGLYKSQAHHFKSLRSHQSREYRRLEVQFNAKKLKQKRSQCARWQRTQLPFSIVIQ